MTTTTPHSTTTDVTIPAPRTELPASPRVWLVAGLGALPEPADYPAVRDNQMRRWEFGDDGRYHSVDGWHHATWAELHARFDLIEVTGA